MLLVKLLTDNIFPGIQTGATALYHAAQEGKDEIVQLLLSQNANVDHQQKVSHNLILFIY